MGSFSRFLTFTLLLLSVPHFSIALPKRASSVVSPIDCKAFLQSIAGASYGPLTEAELYRKKISLKYRYIGRAWNRLFKDHVIPKKGVVVEIAPGYYPKVGSGFDAFEGTYYLVDPEATGLRTVTEHYIKLFPKAKIIPINSTFSEALHLLPKNADALLANHPLDDMIIGNAMSTAVGINKEGLTAFKNVDTENDLSFSMIQQQWNELYADSQKLSKMENQVADEWIKAIETLDPKISIIAQYESYFFKNNGFSGPDQSAKKALDKIKSHFQSESNLDAAALKSSNHDPSRWFIRDKAMEKLPKAK